MKLICGDHTHEVEEGGEVEDVGGGAFFVRDGDAGETIHVVREGDAVHLFWRGAAYVLQEETEAYRSAHRHHHPGGLEAPMPEGAPAFESRRRGREPAPAALDLLKTLLRLRASQFRVAARLVANSDELERLAAGDDDTVPALHGWRAEVFGNDARALRDGQLAIALENGEAVVIEIPAPEKRRAKAR